MLLHMFSKTFKNLTGKSQTFENVVTFYCAFEYKTTDKCIILSYEYLVPQFSVLNESVTLAYFTLKKKCTHIFTQADVDLVILKKLYIDVMPAGCTVAVIDVFDMI